MKETEMTKFTAADLAVLPRHDLVKLARQMGLRTHVLVKVRSGQPHKRITAPSSQLIDLILASQGN